VASPNLFTIEHLSTESSLPDKRASNSESEPSGSLAPDTRANLFEAVKQQVEQKFLYRNSDLTLSRLAQETGLGVHHLSEVLNQHEGKNFYQFINTYRVDDVCKRLQEDPSLKVLDIALDAGFSSKSTFNSIFKKITGTTPTQYRKQLESA
jgi:AraC-like DNA-binding protein